MKQKNKNTTKKSTNNTTKNTTKKNTKKISEYKIKNINTGKVRKRKKQEPTKHKFTRRGYV